MLERHNIRYGIFCSDIVVKHFKHSASVMLHFHCFFNQISFSFVWIKKLVGTSFMLAIKSTNQSLASIKQTVSGEVGEAGCFESVSQLTLIWCIDKMNKMKFFHMHGYLCLNLKLALTSFNPTRICLQRIGTNLHQSLHIVLIVP